MSLTFGTGRRGVPGIDSNDLSGAPSGWHPASGDRIRIVEQLGHHAARHGLDPETAGVLRGFALDNSGDEAGALATEILGSLSRWDHWPAEPVASALAQLDAGGDAEDLHPKAVALVNAMPHCVRGWLHVAEAAMDLGRHREARDAAEQALRLRPGQVRAAILASQAHLALGHFSEARRAIDIALATAPGDPEARHQSGLVHERSNAPRAALSDYRAAARVSDERQHWEAMRDHAVRIDAGDAVREADLAVVRLAPESALAHRHAATSLEAAGRIDAARVHRERAHALAPHAADAGGSTW